MAKEGLNRLKKNGKWVDATEAEKTEAETEGQEFVRQREEIKKPLIEQGLTNKASEKIALRQITQSNPQVQVEDKLIQQAALANIQNALVNAEIERLKDIDSKKKQQEQVDNNTTLPPFNVTIGPDQKQEEKSFLQNAIDTNPSIIAGRAVVGGVKQAIDANTNGNSGIVDFAKPIFKPVFNILNDIKDIANPFNNGKTQDVRIAEQAFNDYDRVIVEKIKGVSKGEIDPYEVEKDFDNMELSINELEKNLRDPAKKFRNEVMTEQSRSIRSQINLEREHIIKLRRDLENAKQTYYRNQAAATYGLPTESFNGTSALNPTQTTPQ